MYIYVYGHVFIHFCTILCIYTYIYVYIYISVYIYIYDLCDITGPSGPKRLTIPVSAENLYVCIHTYI
jgi:hypothetical protein